MQTPFKHAIKQILWQWRGVLLAAPSIAGLVILMRLIGWLQPLEWAAFDQYFCWRSPEPPDSRVVIIGLTEADLQKYRWPLSDQVLAELIEKIRARQPRAIGLDFYRDFPIEPGHAKLTQTFQTTPNLIGIEKVVGDSHGVPIPPPQTLYELDQIGASDTVLDADGRIRRGFLYVNSPMRNGEVVFSLAQRLAFLYLAAEGIEPQLTPENHIKLGLATFVPFAPNDGAYIQTNDAGFQVLLNYRGPKGYFHTLSVSEALNHPGSLEVVRDRIVLIGTTAESVSDRYATPFSSQKERGLPQLMAGVEINANLTSQILSAALDGRSSIQSWSEPIEWLWILTWSIIGAIAAWQKQSASTSIKTRWGTTSFKISLSSATLVGISYLAFLNNWWIPVIPSLFALLGSTVVVTGYIAQMATKIRKTFGRYLTDEVVTSLLETPTGLQLGGEKRKITILMTDLRGFSTISEQLPPEQVVSLLNHYLEAMTEVVTHYGGLVNQVIGDGIVVFFGALNQKPDDAERAVACAIAMQLAMEAVNQQNKAAKLPLLEMGIGINTGEVIVGNIGSLKHAQFTAIGSHMNLASRIESFSVGGQVLISQFTLDEVLNLQIRQKTQARMKGIQTPITLYEVSGIGGVYNLRLPDPQTDLFHLPQEIPIWYKLLEGKQVVGPPIYASLVSLSLKGAEVRSNQAIAPLSNIKVNLMPPIVPDSLHEDIYAKVVSTKVSDIEGFRIHFTHISPKMANYLLSLTGRQSRSFLPTHTSTSTFPDNA